MAHRDRDDAEPIATEPASNGQFYVTEMAAAVVDDQVIWSGTESTTVNGLIGLDLNSNIEIVLQ